MFINQYEEKILKNILFDNYRLTRKDFDLIDYENLIKISSQSLMVPALFYQLKQKNYLNFIPKDFKKYIEEIYKINKNRNEILVSEINSINKILKSKKIKHIFIKGSHYINGIYNDLGERMVGDIDFLVHSSDLKQTVNSLKKNNYTNNYEFKLWKTKHSRRLISKNKLFAVEPHSEIILFRKRNLFSGKDFIKNKKHYSTENLLKICMLNAQINDYGNLYARINLRSLYDFKNILGEKTIDLLKFKNKYYRRFFIISNMYGITDFEINKNLFDIFFLKRFIFKRKLKILRVIDDFICLIIKRFFTIPMQIIEFTINSKYRNHILKKIKKIRFQ